MMSSAVVAFSPVLRSYNVAEGIQAQCYKAMDGRPFLSRSRIADGILALGQETFDLTWSIASSSRRLAHFNGHRCEDKNIS